MNRIHTLSSEFTGMARKVISDETPPLLPDELAFFRRRGGFNHLRLPGNFTQNTDHE